MLLVGTPDDVPNEQQTSVAVSVPKLPSSPSPAGDARPADSATPYVRLPSGRIVARGTGEIVADTWAATPSEPGAPAQQLDLPALGLEQAAEELPKGDQHAGRVLRGMPAEYRAKFPKFELEIHQYEASKDRRFIGVAGQTYREGQRMPSGIRVIEIVEDGVMLLFDGETILYPVTRRRAGK